jgi:GT2 family glycosyltransferase
MEILVVDGMSSDKTRGIVKDYKDKYPFINLLDNLKKITPAGINLGIKKAKGEIIIRLDAHAKYKSDYISKCLKLMEEYDADGVGGIIRTIPANNTLMAKAIALSLSDFFGVGDSYFRAGYREPKWVDTIFGGCYKKEIFNNIGFFNENLRRSQDIEFNIRLKKKGGKILLAPEAIAYYYPSTDLKNFFIHNIQDGIWTIYPFKFTKIPLRLRHYIPLIFILSLPLSIWLYIPLSLYFSAKIAWKKRSFRLFFVMPIVFAARHIGYGFGSLLGTIRLIF